ncbi:hypothetical protein MPTK1_5g13965 [Marchantia polymorpha subsp. ruderalis]
MCNCTGRFPTHGHNRGRAAIIRLTLRQQHWTTEQPDSYEKIICPKRGASSILQLLKNCPNHNQLRVLTPNPRDAILFHQPDKCPDRSRSNRATLLQLSQSDARSRGAEEFG